MRHRSLTLATLIAMMSMLLAACGGAGGGAAATSAPVATSAVAPTTAAAPTVAPTEAMAEPTVAPTEAMAEPTVAPTEAMAEPTAEAATPAASVSGADGIEDLKSKAASISPELVDAFAGKFKGTKVSVTGPQTAEDANKFNDSFKDFEDATGIDVEFEGTKEFEATIAARVEGGSAPDLVDFPQPGLAATFAKSGKIVDITKFIKAEWLKQNYSQSYLDISNLDGPSGKIQAGVWHRAFPKSLVWYPKKAFDAAGYKVPATWDELKALMDQIVADGDTPWCIGIESGAATGWPATDWTEEMMLRTTSLDNYDKWTRGELSFEDPTVKNAVKMWSDIWFNDKYVFGGRAKIVSTSFGDSTAPMFTDPPGCFLHRQGSFITSFFPPDAKPGVDYAVFYLPPIDEKYGKPVLFSGDLMSMFNDRPEVRAVMSFMSSGDSVERWIKAGGATSPHKDSKPDWYTNDIDRQVADILLKAETARFDGSDLMPGVVGAGTFWKGISDYVAGTLDLDKAMEEIQAGWPKK